MRPLELFTHFVRYKSVRALLPPPTPPPTWCFVTHRCNPQQNLHRPKSFSIRPDLALQDPIIMLQQVCVCVYRASAYVCACCCICSNAMHPLRCTVGPKFCQCHVESLFFSTVHHRSITCNGARYTNCIQLTKACCFSLSKSELSNKVLKYILR